MTAADKKKRYAQALVTIAALEARWPVTFALAQNRRRPLAIGIDLHIAAAGGFEPRDVATALRTYCSNEFYLRACTHKIANGDNQGPLWHTFRT
jgi:sRNA-binding protein